MSAYYKESLSIPQRTTTVCLPIISTASGPREVDSEEKGLKVLACLGNLMRSSFKHKMMSKRMGRKVYGQSLVVEGLLGMNKHFLPPVPEKGK